MRRFINIKTGLEISREEANGEFYVCTFASASKKARQCYVCCETGEIFFHDEGASKEGVVLLGKLGNDAPIEKAIVMLAEKGKLDFMSQSKRKAHNLAPVTQPRKPLTSIAELQKKSSTVSQLWTLESEKEAVEALEMLSLIPSENLNFILPSFTYQRDILFDDSQQSPATQPFDPESPVYIDDALTVMSDDNDDGQVLLDSFSEYYKPEFGLS
jgi:hypothetical protein